MNFPSSFVSRDTVWEAPSELPAQHTHIFQGARLPENCPACKNLWDAMNKYIYIADQIEATRLKVAQGDWTEEQQLSYLADLEHTTQKRKYKRLHY